MSRRGIIALSVFILSAIVYIITACPAVFTMDNGELIVAAHNLQITHPTGYPLFCLLYHLGEHLVPFGSTALRMNIFNALIASLAVMMLFLAISEVASKKASAFICLLFAFSPVFWDAATAAEVHALSALIVSSEILFFLKYWKSGDRRYLYPIAILAGLGMANHLSSALILPGMVLGIIVRAVNRITLTPCPSPASQERGISSLVGGVSERRWYDLLHSSCSSPLGGGSHIHRTCSPSTVKRERGLGGEGILATSLICILLFILPLTLYLYLPIREEASRGSIWGDVYKASGFIAHVTGRAYRLRMFTSAAMAWQNLLEFLNLVVAQFPVWMAWMLPFGGLVVKRRDLKLLAALLLMAVLNVVYAVNYSIPDIAPYYIPSMMVFALFAAVGLDYVLENLRLPVSRTAILATMPILLLLVALGNYPRMDRHDARYISNYADNLLKTMEPNALYIACGDSSYNAIMYAQKVEGKRPDVVVIERNILKARMVGDRYWTGRYYFNNLSERLPSLRRFRWPQDYSITDIKREKLLADIITTLIKERPVYISCTGGEQDTHPFLGRIKKHCQLVPEGALLRICSKTDEIDAVKVVRHNEKLWKSYDLAGVLDIPEDAGELERDFPNRYATVSLALADFELKAGLYRLAERHYQQVLALDSRLTRARKGLGVALVCQGRHRESAKEWSTLLAYHPNDKAVQRNLRMARAVLAGN